MSRTSPMYSRDPHLSVIENTEFEKERKLIQMIHIGSVIYDLRTEKGLTLEQLSLLTGISPSSIKLYENNRTKDIPMRKLDLIARVFGLKASEFLALAEDLL